MLLNPLNGRALDVLLIVQAAFSVGFSKSHEYSTWADTLVPVRSIPASIAAHMLRLNSIRNVVYVRGLG